MRKLSVLIVDDNKKLVGMMKDYLANESDIFVSGIAYDGIEALQKIFELKPDIVLLDIVMSGLDGVGVLERLKEEKIEKKPIFIMLSAISQDILVQRAIDLGAEYYIVKPFDMQVVVQRIKFIYGLNGTDSISRRDIYFTTTPKNIAEKIDVKQKIDNEISNVMHIIGIHTNMKGYPYIKEAVMMVTESGKESMPITKMIYPDVAKKHGTSPERVERAIRNAIENMWVKGGTDNLANLFGCTTKRNMDKPTNSEFIAMIADKIRMNLKM